MVNGAAARVVPATACSGISTLARRRPRSFYTPLARLPRPRFGMLFAHRPAASPHNPRSQAMLSWALAFFIIAIIAAVFGFTGIAAGAAEIAKILFVVFVVLFLVSLVAGLLRRP
jgi:uncharacterized membrane protein YtjA (UPF0391 family)